jgi:hypothetical protein
VLRAAGGYRPETVPAEDYDLWLRLLPTHRFLKLRQRLYRHRLHAAQSGARRRPEQVHQSILAKLRYLRRQVPGLPARPRLAIEGGGRGDAFYRAAAPAAGFEVVSGPGWDVLAFTDFARVPSHAIGNFVLRAEWRTQPWSSKRPA